jgi:anti-sigma28 factor (negative regulator of flagellin synthesis)
MLQDDTTSMVQVCVENFQKFREERLRDLQAAINQGDFMIHPKIIASHWLNFEMLNCSISLDDK